MKTRNTSTLSIEDRLEKIKKHCIKEDIELVMQLDSVDETWDVWIDNNTDTPDISASLISDVVEGIESHLGMD